MHVDAAELITTVSAAVAGVAALGTIVVAVHFGRDTAKKLSEADVKLDETTQHLSTVVERLDQTIELASGADVKLGETTQHLSTVVERLDQTIELARTATREAEQNRLAAERDRLSERVRAIQERAMYLLHLTGADPIKFKEEWLLGIQGITLELSELRFFASGLSEEDRGTKIDQAALELTARWIALAARSQAGEPLQIGEAVALIGLNDNLRVASGRRLEPEPDTDLLKDIAWYTEKGLAADPPPPDWQPGKETPGQTPQNPS